MQSTKYILQYNNYCGLGYEGSENIASERREKPRLFKVTTRRMFDVGSRQKTTDVNSKRATTKCIATALVCQPC